MKNLLFSYGDKSTIFLIRKDGSPFLLINLYLLTRKRNLSISRLSYLCTSLKRITSYFDLQDENFEKILIEENYDFLVSKLPNFFNNYLTQYDLSDSAYQDHIIFVRDYILWVINRQFSRCYSKKRSFTKLIHVKLKIYFPYFN